MYLMVLFKLRSFMFWSVRYNIIPGQLGFARINTLLYADIETGGVCT